MLGLRQKLFFGFGGLLLIILVITIQSIIHLTQLGQSIDIILRENYQSVIACENMKESSGALLVFLAQKQMGTELIQKNEPIFEKALRIELNTITLPGEREKARDLQELFEQYKVALHNIQELKPAVNQWQSYINKLFPLFLQIKGTANEILVMNQKNMNDANDRALSSAASARIEIYFFLGVGMIVAVVFMFFTERWIMTPIKRLIHYAEDIKRGNFDLFILDNPRDEIGQISRAFNDMASALRESRRGDQTKEKGDGCL
jgi:nitrate/nitrite-specific signal transduction histidine kinase